MALVVQLQHAARDTLIVWPDEVYQTTEQAHRLVAGFGFIPWEFTAGTRSWIGPALLVPPLWLGSALGARTGAALMLDVRLWLALVSLLTVWGATTLATRLHDRTAGVLAGLGTALAPVPGLYLTHALADTLVMPFVVWSFVAAFSRRRGAAWCCGAGIVLAVALRPQVAVLAVGLVLPLRRRGGRSATAAVAGAALAATAWGALDLVTLGAPFASIWRSIDFNVVRGGADAFGQQPWTFYPVQLVQLTGLVGVAVVLTGVALAPRQGVWIAASALAYVGVLSLIGHKELRFVLPAAPVSTRSGRRRLTGFSLRPWTPPCRSPVRRRAPAASPSSGRSGCGPEAWPRSTAISR